MEKNADEVHPVADAVSASAAPQTPQRRRQPRTDRRKGGTPQAAPTPQPSKTPLTASQATRTPQTNRTPTSGSGATPWSMSDNTAADQSQLDAEESDDDDGGLLGDFDIDDEEDDDADRRALADARLSGPDSGKGGKLGGRGGNRKGSGKGASHSQGSRSGAGVRENRLPPPPSSGSLKALPQEQVQRFLQLVQEGDYAEALKALRKVRRAVKGRGCSKEAFGGMRALLHHLLEGYASADRLQEALEILGDMKRGTEARLVSAAAFNAVLRGLLARSSLDKARFVVREEMPRLGATPNEASLNLLMDTAVRAGHVDEAWDVLEEMQSKKLRADKYTVSILTKGISDRGGDKWRAPRGVALVEHFLVAQPDDVDEVLVNSLLDVFCRMGDMPRLEATLQKMREYGIKGSAVTYGTIVKAYGRAGNIDKVVDAWSEMSRVGLEANAVTYGCMLDACVKCGHIDKALNVFNLMKEQGLHRNTILYATLIKGFAKSKDPTAARQLYQEMVAEGVPCNVVVFNSLIDACVRANDLQSAAEVLQQMTVAGVRPDLITFSTLIKGYCGSGELNKAMRLAEELQARNLECDEIVYNSLLEGCVKAGDLNLGMRLFTQMKTHGVRPSSVTFSILVKLLSRSGRLDLAMHLVATEMREMHGVLPTRMVWSCLVTCCVKSRDLARAAMVLDHIDREGGAGGGGARTSMYSTVIEGCLVQSEVRTALQLCERAYRNAPPEESSRGSLLSSDLLRRIFEAMGNQGPEQEARAVLNSIGSRLGEQARSMCEDALNRGSRRRTPQAPRDKGTSGTPSAGDDQQSAIGLTPPPNRAPPSLWSPSPYQYPGAGISPGGDFALSSGQLSGANGAVLGTDQPMDAAMAANAMAAAAAAATANPWGWSPGMEHGYGFPGFVPPGGYPLVDFYGQPEAGWPWPPPSWNDGTWGLGLHGVGTEAFAAAAAAAAVASAAASVAPSVAAVAEDGSELKAADQCSTPSAGAAGKTLETTPATTAGRVSESPIGDGERLAEHCEELQTHESLQQRLFPNEPTVKSEVAFAAPPGLGKIG